jgi:single-stranded DNA-specific DHH superfamily exonuclease
MLNPEKFASEFKKTISQLVKQKAKEITLVHHDDADGLCSAALTQEALKREGFKVNSFCLEKIYPEVIQALHFSKGRTIFYADIGSGQASFISDCNQGKNFVVILDHHLPTPVRDKEVRDLNLRHWGYDEREFSGATCCYLFARALDEDNKDLSYLALVGSLEIPGGWVGLNKKVLEEAIKEGIVKEVEGKFLISRFGITLQKLYSALNILGPVGYYQGGPRLGIRACLEGLLPGIKRKAKELEEKRKEANKKILGELPSRMRESKQVQWFDVDNEFKGMGVKVVGSLCSYLSFQRRLVKPFKYILGMMNVSKQIPGFGKLKREYVKISVRIPQAMRKHVEQGKLPKAIDLLLKAGKNFVVADGHAQAASGIIPLEKKEEFLRNLAEEY